MGFKIIGRDIIDAAILKFKSKKNLKKALEAWMAAIAHCEAKHPMELKKTFNSLDPVPPQTVFDICGNEFRLIVKINYQAKIIIIQHVLTHKEYDKNNWKEK